MSPQNYRTGPDKYHFTLTHYASLQQKPQKRPEESNPQRNRGRHNEQRVSIAFP